MGLSHRLMNDKPEESLIYIYIYIYIYTKSVEEVKCYRVCMPRRTVIFTRMPTLKNESTLGRSFLNESLKNINENEWRVFSCQRKSIKWKLDSKVILWRLPSVWVQLSISFRGEWIHSMNSITPRIGSTCLSPIKGSNGYVVKLFVWDRYTWNNVIVSTLVSPFKGISTFVGYLLLKPFL